MGQLLKIEQVAERLEVPVHTLYDWRRRGLGPVSIRLGRRLAYRADDCDAWLEQKFADAQAARDAAQFSATATNPTPAA